ncbi:hypothetical protein WN944_000684 [Citrus x changshan-huyou]|uniref:MAPK kinase substrate protein n=1 Tax=Citrus x changshan-huyou TaxID=2935761 RepID=A0AAP0QQN0_9ROSI
MEGLSRSTTSFRRQGSSGLVWDDKFLSGDLNRLKKNKEADDHINKPKAAAVMMQRSRSEGGGGGGGGGGVGRMHRALKEPPSALDPPSPKLSGCGFCGFFGKPAAAHKQKSHKRKSTRS